MSYPDSSDCGQVRPTSRTFAAAVSRCSATSCMAQESSLAFLPMAHADISAPRAAEVVHRSPNVQLLHAISQNGCDKWTFGAMNYAESLWRASLRADRENQP